MIPIPKTQRELLDGPKSNAALYFARMTECENGKIAQNAIVVLGERLNSRFPIGKGELEKLHTRQVDFVGAATQHAGTTGNGLALEIRARLIAPFVSGLGLGHPTETGLTLDRNTGLPYIPASSVKGVLRLACALHIAETEPDEVVTGKNGAEIPDTHPLLRRYFGDTAPDKADGLRGQLVFLDAFPAETSASLLKTDIMNPHFGRYYSGEQGPLETENPIPVKFLAVNPGTEFVFRCFALPLPERKPDVKDTAVCHPFGKTDEETVIALFKRAFASLGFGSKTTIGYGRFEVRDEDIKETATLRDEFTEKQKQKLLAEEAAKYPWRPLLAGIEQVDWGMLRQRYLANTALQEYQSNPEVGAAVRNAAAQLRKSQKKKWKEEWDAFLQKWLEPAGITWPPKGDAPLQLSDTPAQAGDGGQTQAPPQSELSELEQLIHALKDYGQYKSQNIDLARLTLPEAQALQGRFKAWGFDATKNDEKKKLWKNLQNRIKRLKQ